MKEYVDAAPAKRFFVDMLVRDIRLEDAIIDLVDNAVDSLIRREQIDLPVVVTGLGEGRIGSAQTYFVDIKLDESGFCIQDNCGGIEFEEAKNHVFRFGAEERPKDARLSVYGIGLKRAVLKLGRKIEVESRTLSSGFRVNMDVEEFEGEPNKWRFPISTLEPATHLSVLWDHYSGPRTQRHRDGEV